MAQKKRRPFREGRYNALEVYLHACSYEDSAILGDLFPTDGFALEDQHYSLRPPQGFSPSRIYLAKGSNTTPARRDFIERICRVYPEAQVVEAFQTPHNRIALGESNPIELHRAGKRTLVLAEHNSAVRFSTEEDNSNQFQFKVARPLLRFPRLPNMMATF